MIKASLILSIVFVVARLTRHRSAAERHMLWVAGITVATVLPILSMLMPDWRPAIAVRVASVLPSISKATQSQKAADTSEMTVHANSIESGERLDLILLLAWATGSFVALCLLSAGSARLRRLVFQGQPLSHPLWTKTADQLIATFGFERKVEF